MWISDLYGSDVTLEQSISLLSTSEVELVNLQNSVKHLGKKIYIYISVLFGKKMHLYLLRISEILEK